MKLLLLLALVLAAFCAQDTLLSLSRTSSCLKDLVSSFIRAEDCSKLADSEKAEVTLSISSWRWRWVSAWWRRWEDHYLKSAI